MRVQLARIAHDAAMATEGVVDTDAGPVGARMTLDGAKRLQGVTSTVLPDGRYGLSLHLVCRMVPLHPLVDALRARLERAAAAAGVADELGPVDITIEDVREDSELGGPAEAEYSPAGGGTA